MGKLNFVAVSMSTASLIGMLVNCHQPSYMNERGGNFGYIKFIVEQRFSKRVVGDLNTGGKQN